MTTRHVGLLMLFCNSRVLVGLQRRLAAVGQMALSHSMTHSIVCGVIFYGIGFGLYGRLHRHQLYYVVAAIWVVQRILSPIWLARYQFGPLEWLWRTLTYGKRQPMPRTAKVTVGQPSVAAA